MKHRAPTTTVITSRSCSGNNIIKVEAFRRPRRLTLGLGLGTLLN